MISQLWQKNEIDDLKAGRSDHPAPLKSEDVAVRWENLKEKLNAVEIVFDLEKDRRRNLEVRWQSFTIRDKCYEAERSFTPILLRTYSTGTK